jgi:hypothetical protein
MLLDTYNDISRESHSLHYSREKVRTTPNVVMYETVGNFFLPKILDGVCPKDISHETMSRRLPEPIELVGCNGRNGE